MCLDCRPKEQQLRNTVNFCDLHICGEKSITSEQFTSLEAKKPHRPTHDFVKLRSVLHLKDMPELDRKAQWALERSRSLFQEAQRSGRPASAETVIDGEAVREDPEGLSSRVEKQASEPAARDAVHVPDLSEAPNGLQAQPPPLEDPNLAEDEVLGVRPVSQEVSESKEDRAPLQPPSGVLCYSCHKSLTQPCWYCVTCDAGEYNCRPITVMY